MYVMHTLELRDGATISIATIQPGRLGASQTPFFGGHDGIQFMSLIRMSS